MGFHYHSPAKRLRSRRQKRRNKRQVQLLTPLQSGPNTSTEIQLRAKDERPNLFKVPGHLSQSKSTPLLQPLDDPRTREHQSEYYHKKVQHVLGPIIESMIAQGSKSPEEFIVAYLAAKNPRLAQTAERIKYKRVLLQEQQAKTRAMQEAVSQTKQQIKDALNRQKGRKQRLQKEEEIRKEFRRQAQSADRSRLARERLIRKDPVAAVTGAVTIDATQLHFSHRFSILAENISQRSSQVQISSEELSFSARYTPRQGKFTPAPSRRTSGSATTTKSKESQIFAALARCLDSTDTRDLADAVSELVSHQRPDLVKKTQGLMNKKLRLAETKAAILKLQLNCDKTQDDVTAALNRRTERVKKGEEERQAKRRELEEIAKKRSDLSSKIATLLDKDAAVARSQARNEKLRRDILRKRAAFVSALQLRAQRVEHRDKIAAINAACLGRLDDQEERHRVLNAIRELRPDLADKIDAVEAKDAEVASRILKTQASRAQILEVQEQLQLAMQRYQARQQRAGIPNKGSSPATDTFNSEFREELLAIGNHRPELAGNIKDILAREERLQSMKEQTRGLDEELKKTRRLLENATERRKKRAGGDKDSKSHPEAEICLDAAKLKALREIAKKRPELADKVKILVSREELLTKRKADNLELSKAVSKLSANLSSALKRREARLQLMGDESSSPETPGGSAPFVEILQKRPELGAQVADITKRDTSLSMQKKKTAELQAKLDEVLKMQRCAEQSREVRVARQQAVVAA